MSELRPFSRLSPDEDPQNVAALVRSVQEAPEEDIPRLRWRLRADLHKQAWRPGRFLRMALIAGGMFLAGGVVGAVVRPFLAIGPTAPATTAEPAAKARPRPAGKRITTAPAEKPPEQPPAVPVESPSVAPVPNSIRRAPQRLAARLSVPPIGDPPAAPRVAVAAQPPSPIALEQGLLANALRSLRKQHDARGALDLLDQHARGFPGTALGPEATMLRAEALLGLGRNAEALTELDRLSLGSTPKPGDRLVLRGELRAAAGRWREALNDFDTQLVDATSPDLTERALWGRAATRSHLGDEAGARADLARYLRTYPSGRFAARAAALLQVAP
jgi:hypothetical protein